MTSFTAMNLGENIKNIRKERGLQQKQVALEIGVDQSNYNKIENGKREPSVAALKQLADIFGVTLDFLVNPDKDLPQEVVIEDKAAAEQLRLIAELDKEDKDVIFKMIDTMLTKKKFKDFFQENIGK
jgi:transcriptional regulator with XRE-family HTH domain